MTDNIIVHTPTLEDYIEVVKYAISIGINWIHADNNNYIKIDYWEDYREKTCININFYTECTTYSSYMFYTECFKKIISMEEFNREFNHWKKILEWFR